MDKRDGSDLISDIFSLATNDRGSFDGLWQEVYAYQLAHCQQYNRYCKSLGAEAPAYLPIEAFKYVPLTTFPAEEAERIFHSSGTGRGGRSAHYVRYVEVYKRALSLHFSRLFGSKPLTLIAHLPHYQDMGTSSSLLYMVDYLIEQLGDEYSGFSLGNEDLLTQAINAKEQSNVLFIVFGAAFGLLDLVESQSYRLPENAIVIETGGMKTYRKEVARTILHQKLAEGFGLPEDRIWSEYGMCELLSQCYTRGGQVFFPPPWMRFEIMNPEEPLKKQDEGKPGTLAVIDLANLYSVSAILTQDRAIARGSGFEVLGRLNGAELRGCNFLLEKL